MMMLERPRAEVPDGTVSRFDALVFRLKAACDREAAVQRAEAEAIVNATLAGDRKTADAARLNLRASRLRFSDAEDQLTALQALTAVQQDQILARLLADAEADAARHHRSGTHRKNHLEGVMLRGVPVTESAGQRVGRAFARSNLARAQAEALRKERAALRRLRPDVFTVGRSQT